MDFFTVKCMRETEMTNWKVEGKKGFSVFLLCTYVFCLFVFVCGHFTDYTSPFNTGGWNFDINTYRVSPKKCTSDFFSHHWHKYFTHMENKDRYGILIISAFHAIFCFYSTPFQFFAIIRQSMSPPIFIHFILHLFKMSTITCNAFVASSFDI